MELMSQYDATIHYLPGEENCATDVLSRLPDPALTMVAKGVAKHEFWICCQVVSFRGFRTPPPPSPPLPYMVCYSHMFFFRK